jgi:hypothetical protein
MRRRLGSFRLAALRTMGLERSALFQSVVFGAGSRSGPFPVILFSDLLQIFYSGMAGPRRPNSVFRVNRETAVPHGDPWSCVQGR